MTTLCARQGLDGKPAQKLEIKVKNHRMALSVPGEVCVVHQRTKHSSLQHILGCGVTLCLAATDAQLRHTSPDCCVVRINGENKACCLAWRYDPTNDCNCYGDSIHYLHGFVEGRNLALISIKDSCLAWPSDPTMGSPLL